LEHLVAGTVPIVHDGSPKIIFQSKPFHDFVQFHMFFSRSVETGTAGSAEVALGMKIMKAWGANYCGEKPKILTLAQSLSWFIINFSAILPNFLKTQMTV